MKNVELDGEKLRKEALEARRLADTASNEEDRQFWLRIADEWSKVVREPRESKDSAAR